jgi:hypothetical protein
MQTIVRLAATQSKEINVTPFVPRIVEVCTSGYERAPGWARVNGLCRCVHVLVHMYVCVYVSCTCMCTCTCTVRVHVRVRV